MVCVINLIEEHALINNYQSHAMLVHCSGKDPDVPLFE